MAASVVKISRRPSIFEGLPDAAKELKEKREKEEQEKKQRELGELLQTSAVGGGFETPDLGELLTLSADSGFSPNVGLQLFNTLDRRAEEAREEQELADVISRMRQAGTRKERQDIALEALSTGSSAGVVIAQNFETLLGEGSAQGVRDISAFDEQGNEQKFTVPKNATQQQIEQTLTERGLTRVEPGDGGDLTDTQRDVRSLSKQFTGSEKEKRDKARVARKTQKDFLREIDKRTKNTNEQGLTVTRSSREDVLNSIAKSQFSEVVDAGASDIGDQVNNAISEAEGILSALEAQIPQAVEQGRTDQEIINQLKTRLNLSGGEAKNLLDEIKGSIE